MTQKIKSVLLAESETIRDETTANANTATRVGQHLYDLIDSYISNIDPTGQVIYGQLDILGQAKGGAVNPSFSASASFNMNNGNMQKMILTGNITSLTLTNKYSGSSYLIILEQGGSGGYTIATPDSTFGSVTDNSVDSGDWPTTVGSKLIINVNVEPDGNTHYSVETITV